MATPESSPTSEQTPFGNLELSPNVGDGAPTPMSTLVVDKLGAMHPVAFVLTMLSLSYIVVLPLQFFLPPLGQGSISILSLGPLWRFLIGALIVPVVETLLFQWAPVRIVTAGLGWSKNITIPISAALFALMHYYSIQYVLFTFLIGLVLAFGFVVRDVPRGRPILLTCLIHALRNAIAFVAMMFV